MCYCAFDSLAHEYTCNLSRIYCAKDTTKDYGDSKK